jgi:hypothetical protein
MYIFSSCISSKYARDTLVSENLLHICGHTGILLYCRINQYLDSCGIRNRRYPRFTRPSYKRRRIIHRLFTFFRGRNKAKYYNQTFKPLVGVSLERDSNYRLQLCVGSLSVEELRFYAFAMKYLKNKHAKESKDWDEINRNIGIYNVESGKIQLYLRKIIPLKMNDHYQNYENHYDKPVAETKGVNYYNSLEILRQIFNHKYENESSKDKHEYEFSNSMVGTYETRYLLRNVSQQILVESNNQEDYRPEKLIGVLNEICTDVTLTNDIRKLVSLHKIVEGDIQKFRQNMKALSEEIEMRSGELGS